MAYYNAAILINTVYLIIIAALIQILKILRIISMQKNIHPAYESVSVTCSCGNAFVTRSTLGKKELHIEICSSCHPFYTGEQKMIDTAGRVERFNEKFKSFMTGSQNKQAEQQ